MNAPAQSTFAALLAKSAISAHMTRLGGNWRQVARTLQDDFGIDFNSYDADHGYMPDYCPLATWSRMLFPQLQPTAYNHEIVAYLSDGEEITVEMPEPVREFQRRWITNTIYTDVRG